MPRKHKTGRFVLKSPYGYLTPKFDKSKPVFNGAIGTILENGRVRFPGLRETVEVPRHWRAKVA